MEFREPSRHPVSSARGAETASASPSLSASASLREGTTQLCGSNAGGHTSRAPSGFDALDPSGRRGVASSPKDSIAARCLERLDARRAPLVVPDHQGARPRSSLPSLNRLGDHFIGARDEPTYGRGRGGTRGRTRGYRRSRPERRERCRRPDLGPRRDPPIDG